MHVAYKGDYGNTDANPAWPLLMDEATIELWFATSQQTVFRD
jgi:hypothetical protein